MLNPFDPQPASVFRHKRSHRLVEALVVVPMPESTAVCITVIVPIGEGCDDWARRAETAAIVTVAAVRARLLAASQGDPE